MTVSAKTVYRENGETKQILNTLHTVFCHMFGDLWSLDLSQPNSPEANQQLKTYFRRKKGILSPPPTQTTLHPKEQLILSEIKEIHKGVGGRSNLRPEPKCLLSQNTNVTWITLLKQKKTGCEHKTATFKPTFNNCKSISFLSPVLPTGALKIAPSLSHAPWRIQCHGSSSNKKLEKANFPYCEG
jgi:hypothetical protein